MNKKTIILFFVTIAIWFVAGYAIGLARGKGWRAAMIDNRCSITCLPTSTVKL